MLWQILKVRTNPSLVRRSPCAQAISRACSLIFYWLICPMLRAIKPNNCLSAMPLPILHISICIVFKSSFRQLAAGRVNLFTGTGTHMQGRNFPCYFQILQCNAVQYVKITWEIPSAAYIVTLIGGLDSRHGPDFCQIKFQLPWLYRYS